MTKKNKFLEYLIAPVFVLGCFGLLWSIVSANASENREDHLIIEQKREKLEECIGEKLDKIRDNQSELLAEVTGIKAILEK